MVMRHIWSKFEHNCHDSFSQLQTNLELIYNILWLQHSLFSRKSLLNIRDYWFTTHRLMRFIFFIFTRSMKQTFQIAYSWSPIFWRQCLWQGYQGNTQMYSRGVSIPGLSTFFRYLQRFTRCSLWQGWWSTNNLCGRRQDMVDLQGNFRIVVFIIKSCKRKSGFHM